MNELVVSSNCIPPMSLVAINKVRELEEIALTMPQVDIETSHLIHAGMYARTIMMAAGTLITGALIKIATILIAQGDIVVYIGDKSIELSGYNVIPASANRKQAFFAKTDTYLTMIFPSNVMTIKEAEEQFTDDANQLLSRNEGLENHIIITGE